mmetsp:Transcript_3026/g.5136  ORF Transcript_3026/g.5136 Transcript_3026/m.5136 type:complete len:98 (-) Transcript_3026:8-301(-)
MLSEGTARRICFGLGVFAPGSEDGGILEQSLNSENSVETKTEMVNNLAQSVLNDEIQCAPTEVFELQDYQKALLFDKNQSGVRSKIVLIFRRTTLKF